MVRSARRPLAPKSNRGPRPDGEARRYGDLPRSPAPEAPRGRGSSDGPRGSRWSAGARGRRATSREGPGDTGMRKPLPSVMFRGCTTGHIGFCLRNRGQTSDERSSSAAVGSGAPPSAMAALKGQWRWYRGMDARQGRTGFHALTRAISRFFLPQRLRRSGPQGGGPGHIVPGLQVGAAGALADSGAQAFDRPQCGPRSGGPAEFRGPRGSTRWPRRSRPQCPP